jgi:hypothetical protein
VLEFCASTAQTERGRVGTADLRQVAPRQQGWKGNDPSGVNMRRRLWSPSPLLVLVFASTVLQCQQLVVQTDTGRRVLSRADLEALPQVKVMASEHSTAPVSFEGVALMSVLEKAGVENP